MLALLKLFCFSAKSLDIHPGVQMPLLYIPKQNLSSSGVYAKNVMCTSLHVLDVLRLDLMDV